MVPIQLFTTGTTLIDIQVDPDGDCVFQSKSLDLKGIATDLSKWRKLNRDN